MRMAGLLRRCLGLGLLLMAGCDPLKEGQYFREGIGTDLNGPELAGTTALLDRYVGFICKQAGLDHSPDGPTILCNAHGFRPQDWVEFVKAGMNDIDVRCDAYLAWLDNRRRSRGPLLQQIMDTSRAADAILDVAGVGVHQITIVGQAFGLAANTFTNVNSRLLLEVNQSTVQSVVHKSMEHFRSSKKYTDAATRSEAIHYLRSYLRLCMPFTIETDINTTVSIVKRVGPESLVNNALIEPETHAPDLPSLPAAVPGPREGAIVPKAKGVAAVNGRRQVPPAVEDYAKHFKSYSPKEFPPSQVKKVLQALCAPQGDLGRVDETTGDLIRIWEQVEPSDRITRDGVIDGNERDLIASLRKFRNPCPVAKVKNAYERQRFKDGSTTDIAGVIELLNKVPIADQSSLDRTRALNSPEVRARIAAVRRELEKTPEHSKNLTKLPDSMAEQWTQDLFQALRAYKMPSAQAAPATAEPTAPIGQPPEHPVRNGIRPGPASGRPSIPLEKAPPASESSPKP